MFMDLDTILRQPISAYDENKDQFKALALDFLKQVAKDLKLPKESYDISFNPGGPAVGGDAYLHHDKLYLWVFSGFQFDNPAVLYRTCKGRNDFTGGTNCYYTLRDIELDYPRFLNTMRKIIEG